MWKAAVYMWQKHCIHNLEIFIHTFRLNGLIGFMTLLNSWQHQQGHRLKDQENYKVNPSEKEPRYQRLIISQKVLH